MSEPRLTLQQFAWLNAALDSGKPRAEVLAMVGLDELGLRTERQLWLEIIARRAERNQLDLAQRYANEYMTHRFTGLPPSPAPAPAPQPSPWTPELPAGPTEQAPPAAPVTAEPARGPQLSLYEFAMLRAELDVSPQDAERAWTKYGLVEAASRQREFEAWQRQLQEDSALRSEFKRLHSDAQRHWRSLLVRRP